MTSKLLALSELSFCCADFPEPMVLRTVILDEVVRVACGSWGELNDSYAYYILYIVYIYIIYIYIYILYYNLLYCIILY